MFKHLLRTTLRSLLRNRVFTAINFLGLATGMLAFILIMIFVKFELSYDRFHENGDRVYRLSDKIFKDNELVQYKAQTYPKVGPTLKNDYQEVEAFSRLFPVSGGALISANNNIFSEDRIFFADDSFFKLFTFPFIHSNSANPLEKPNTAIITESIARKYFDTKDPIGQSLTFDWYGNKIDFSVEGVVQDPPANTHLKFNVLFSYPTLLPLSNGDSERSWGWSNFYTYLMLEPTANPELVQRKMDGFVENYIKSDQKRDQFELQPLADIHLHSTLSDELEPSGNSSIVNLVMVVAAFVLLMAWINYINLSVARSSERAKEVAIRKINGAQRLTLIVQFLFEAFFVNLLAVIVTIIVLAVTIPFYGALTGIQLTSDIFKDSLLWFTILVVFLSGVIASGISPALIISSFKPMSVLVGKVRAKRHGLQNAFVIFQYATAAFLIICIVTVSRQIQFLKDRDSGFHMDDVLVVKGPKNTSGNSYVSDYNRFRDYLESQPIIESFTSSNTILGNSLNGIMQYIRPIGTSERDANTFYGQSIDQHFFNTYGIAILAGKNFSGINSVDEGHIILNEAGIELLGFNTPHSAIHKQIIGPEGTEVEIIGVVREFHQLSPRNGYYPTYFVFTETPAPQIFYSIHFNTVNPKDLVASLESKWSSFFPGSAFEHFFLDDFYNRQYLGEMQLRKILAFFTFVAIIITCLGFFALVSFNIAIKSKEIGVRKVFGASTQGIVFMFYRNFFRLILIANIIAGPLAFYCLSQWLNNFAFKAKLDMLPFVISLALLVIVSFFAVGANTFKAARANVIDSMRHE